MKNIIYIGHNIGFPNTAMYIHCQNVAKILKLIGYNVVFVCTAGERIGEKTAIHEGFKYYYANQSFSSRYIIKIEKYIESLIGSSLYKCFKEVCSEYTPCAIICYGICAEKKLKNYAKKNNISFIVERVDWFEKTERRGFIRKNVEQWLCDRAYLKHDLDANGVIVISDFLRHFYLSKGMKVIQIPPVFEVKHLDVVKYHNGNPVKLVYCGSLGCNKDSIFPIIESLLHLNKSKIKFVFSIIGISEQELACYYNLQKLKSYGIIVAGRVENTIARDLIRESDFSFLLRENKRYAKAGFSTKFAESMSLGVPVICNKVGGADSVITDKYNGILLNSPTKEDVINCLSEISTYDESKINELKQNALNFASVYFNYNTYKMDLEHFISVISSSNNRD